MYQVEYYVKAVEVQVLTFKTIKEAKNDMIAFIDHDKKDLNGAGYKRSGSLREGYIEYRHPVFGVDSYVRLRQN